VSLEIALLNNMPDAALDATERQFRAILGTAGGDMSIHLTMYTLPEIPRSKSGQQLVGGYANIDDLWNRRVDGLIVTGTEPRAVDLEDEPFWNRLTSILEWAERSTHSTILSCLAAHAGILHIDGIVRRALSDKRFGVFDCVRVAEHALTADAPGRLQAPHSRWNEIPEEALASCGYQTLTRSDSAGVDAFVKQRNSLFVFLQGHPEYEATTLLLEYRRDVGRFLNQERATYPSMPAGYFDDVTVGALSALRERAINERRPELLAEFPLALAAARVSNSWRPTAEALYRNWLRWISDAKERRRHAITSDTTPHQQTENSHRCQPSARAAPGAPAGRTRRECSLPPGRAGENQRRRAPRSPSSSKPRPSPHTLDTRARPRPPRSRRLPTMR
jgi:homoserine O-succinyltransferase/O-acetyltransferase